MPRCVFHYPWTLSTFEKIEPLCSVDEGFPYNVGTKIALLAYCNSKNGLIELDGIFETDDFVSTLDESDVHLTLILTGEITYNGVDHIEYNINTAGGCSGAQVIVADPESEDFKKVIAVHVGYSEDLDQNVGFKTNRIFLPPPFPPPTVSLCPPTVTLRPPTVTLCPPDLPGPALKLPRFPWVPCNTRLNFGILE